MYVLFCKAIVTATIVLIGGCAAVEKARVVGAEAVARAIVAECYLVEAERQKNLEAINLWLSQGGHAHRAMATDCDGDGSSDF